MAFSKEKSRENKKMFTQAMKLWQESDYDPNDTPRGGVGEHRQFIEQYDTPIMITMYLMFPDINKNRIRHQVTKARIRIYSKWVRERES